jgi:hypothetical protein
VSEIAGALEGACSHVIQNNAPKVLLTSISRYLFLFLFLSLSPTPTFPLSLSHPPLLLSLSPFLPLSLSFFLSPLSLSSLSLSSLSLSSLYLSIYSISRSRYFSLSHFVSPSPSPSQGSLLLDRPDAGGRSGMSGKGGGRGGAYWCKRGDNKCVWDATDQPM